MAKYVSLSNICDTLLRKKGSKIFVRRKPVQRAHREVVVLVHISFSLLVVVLKTVEFSADIEPLSVFSVTAFHLTVVSWRIRSDLLVTYSHLLQYCLE